MQLSIFSSIDTKSRVDKANGVIYGVSVITVGEAEGHDLWIDKTTLSQVCGQGRQFSDGIKVKLKHDDKGKEQSPVHAIVGSLKNFRVKGDKTIADFHLLKTDPNFDKIVEMSESIPQEFGLSVAFSGTPEKIDEKKFARCEELYSVDLTDDPAANPDGLFSKGLSTKPKECDCGKSDCKMCMSRKEKESKTKMSAIMNLDIIKLRSALKLDENATEEQLSEALINRLSAVPADTTQLASKLETLTTELASIKKAGENNVSLSKKQQIDALIAEASKSGKELPFDNDDLYTVAADGAISVKMEPAMLSKVLGKIVPTVKLSRAAALVIPTDKDGKAIAFSNNEERKQWCLAKQAEGASELQARFSSLKNKQN